MDNQSYRVRLSRVLDTDAVADVNGASWDCFPLGPGLEVYGLRVRAFRVDAAMWGAFVGALGIVQMWP